ncbi:hypothetical protein [Lacrimispora celerecrescens]|uniref:Uncharacterized protein n=1 Tax=Lacrimispora celerecrescens TaxID=29354 RepID=A0A084JQD3_9FIRM|nr:hypothetical protein [Lacrimispora celerecrescens]KEZ91167.1 hypothetical protein IO98_05335 [Lacrimispora celerecrescens]
MKNSTITVSKKTKDKIDRLGKWTGLKCNTCVKLLIYEQYEHYLTDPDDFREKILRKRNGQNKENIPITIGFSDEYTDGFYEIEEELDSKTKKNTILKNMILMELDVIFSEKKFINRSVKEVLEIFYKDEEEFKRLNPSFNPDDIFGKEALEIVKKINISRRDAIRWLLAKHIILSTKHILTNE